MQKTPKGLRLQIGIFGRRNVGKSSFLNALTRQKVSIVSATPGTTTDPVEKAMELLPIGPVLFIDTAGIDDQGDLGLKRVDRTNKIIERIDVGILVTTHDKWGEYEENILSEFKKKNVSVIVAFNKQDLGLPDQKVTDRLTAEKISHFCTSAITGAGVMTLKEKLIDIVPEEFLEPASIAGDLVPPGELAILVVPIDLEAPKGRLILPQVQTIRDLLDNDSYCMVVKERELRTCLDRLKIPPALVITDSQAFLKVAGDVPDEVPMTSFSILFSRFKGDLEEFAKGAKAIEQLKSGDKILIAEACSHHPIGEDIGRVKIPRWLTQFVGGSLDFDFTQGHDYPQSIDQYQLIIHCGACTFNRRQLLHRIMQCREAGVPITNYGMAISFSLGIFERAMQPFNIL